MLDKALGSVCMCRRITAKAAFKTFSLKIPKSFHDVKAWLTAFLFQREATTISNDKPLQ